MFRQNPNIETRNSKQIRIPNDKMTKTNLLKFHCFCHWSILIFVIVSDFEFLTENLRFSVKYYVGLRPTNHS